MKPRQFSASRAGRGRRPMRNQHGDLPIPPARFLFSQDEAAGFADGPERLEGEPEAEDDAEQAGHRGPHPVARNLLNPPGRGRNKNSPPFAFCAWQGGRAGYAYFTWFRPAWFRPEKRPVAPPNRPFRRILHLIRLSGRPPSGLSLRSSLCRSASSGVSIFPHLGFPRPPRPSFLSLSEPRKSASSAAPTEKQISSNLATI